MRDHARFGGPRRVGRRTCGGQGRRSGVGRTSAHHARSTKQRVVFTTAENVACAINRHARDLRTKS